MSVVVRFFFALGIVLAVVARGVDGRLECYTSFSNKHYVVDKDKCWADTMNTRFGMGKTLMLGCSTSRAVSCCSVALATRCVYSFTLSPAFPQTMSTLAHVILYYR